MPVTTIIERVSDSAPPSPWNLSAYWPWRGGDAFEAGEEVDVPEGAAELAVGDALQAGGFLHRHRAADLAILDRLQVLRGDLAVLEILPRLLQL